MTEKTDEPNFASLTDRARQDRLQAEIIAFAETFRDKGYDNLEIARELVQAGFEKANTETVPIQESFYQSVRDCSIRFLANQKVLNRRMGLELHRKNLH